MSGPAGPESAPALARRLSLWQVALYGLGTTIGAGIYVLVGETAGRAGVHAPVAFLLAAVVMGLSAASYAEFAGRVPRADGSAAYVRAGFGSETLALAVGLLIVFSGLVSAAAVALGSAGYVRGFVELPASLLVVLIVLGVGAVAAWGIAESVTLAALITLIEAGGLALIIGSGLAARPEILAALPSVLPVPADLAAWRGVLAASLLAFYAFIGFEDIAVLGEEARAPRRTLPRAILITLVVTTLLYFGVTAVAVLGVPPAELARSERLGAIPPGTLGAIGVVATLNGVIIQVIMAARILYGLARQGSLPAALARVHPRTRTPP